jgi:hypothetical protein
MLKNIQHFLPKFGGLFEFCGTLSVGKKMREKCGEIRLKALIISIGKKAIKPWFSLFFITWV